MVKNRNVNNTKKVAIKNKAANGKIVKKGPGKPRVITDARQKIIQKKRTNVVDARDVLASMAKTQDARAKLQKLRGVPGPKTNIKQIGKHILQKTDKNGKICLVTNKSKAATNINNKIREQLGLGASRVPPQRPKKFPARKEAGPLNLKRTISNDYHPAPLPTSSAYYHPHDMYPLPSYANIAPVMPVEIRRPMMDMPVTRPMVSDAPSSHWNNYTAPIRSNGTFMEVDSDEEHVVSSRSHAASRPGMSRLSSNIHSRLDSAVPTSHGILAQAKTKVVVPAGHRIVVSNLQSTVTQDDIRELFEDIGQLLVARLVRPGTAEVIYKNLKDAQKAVDTYHNRQLDGQPMKCLLVNKRPLNNPTAPAIKSNDSVRSTMSSSATTDKLVPDLSTIHKVLFQRH